MQLEEITEHRRRLWGKGEHTMFSLLLKIIPNIYIPMINLSFRAVKQSKFSCQNRKGEKKHFCRKTNKNML